MTSNLSALQLNILRLAALGFSNKDIAQMLSFSPNTIRNQLHQVQLRFHTKTRTQTVIMAIILGEIALPDRLDLETIT